MKLPIALIFLATLVKSKASNIPINDNISPYNYAPDYEYLPANYEYGYGVDTRQGSIYTAKEARQGDLTKGEYHVDLPDGRTQHVNYYVNGPSGYVAVVTYTKTGLPNLVPVLPAVPVYQPVSAIPTDQSQATNQQAQSSLPAYQAVPATYQAVNAYEPVYQPVYAYQPQYTFDPTYAYQQGFAPAYAQYYRSSAPWYYYG